MPRNLFFRLDLHINKLTFTWTLLSIIVFDFCRLFLFCIFMEMNKIIITMNNNILYLFRGNQLLIKIS